MNVLIAWEGFCETLIVLFYLADCVLYQVTLKWSVIQSKDNCVAVIDGCKLCTHKIPLIFVFLSISSSH